MGIISDHFMRKWSAVSFAHCLLILFIFDYGIAIGAIINKLSRCIRQSLTANLILNTLTANLILNALQRITESAKIDLIHFL